MVQKPITYAEGIANLKKAEKNLRELDEQIDRIESEILSGQYRKCLIFVEGDTVGECTVIQMEVTKGNPNDHLTTLKKERAKAYWEHINVLKKLDQ